MRLNSRPFVFLLIAILSSACGGGGGGGGGSTSPDGSYSYTPSSLAFSAQVDAGAPADKIITLTAESSDSEIPDISINPGVIESVAWEIVSSDIIEVSVRPSLPALLGVGTHQSAVTVTNSSVSVDIPVTYTVTEIPPGVAEVHYIAPYIIAPSSTSEAIIRGSGFSRFDDSSLPTITIGSQAVSNVSIVNDTTITLTTPSLTVGSHAVEMSGDGVTFSSSAQLQVLDGQTYSTTSFVLAGVKSRLIYDRERNSIYVVNTGIDVLERYRYQSNTTWDYDSLSLSGLSDAALSPDGETLVLVDGASFHEVDLSASTFAVNKSVGVSLDLYESLDRVAPTNSGVMMGGGDDQWTPVFTYNLRSGEAEKLIYLNSSGIEVEYLHYEPWLFGVHNGSRVYLGETGSSASRLYVLDSSDNSVSETGLSTSFGGYTDVAQSADGSITLVNAKDIYDGDVTTLLGSLPQAHTAGVVSPDGNTVYVFTDFTGTQSNLLKAYDISNPAAPVQIGSDVILAPGPGMRAKMKISSDANTLFIAGLDNLNIIDLTTFSF